jgi:hypothetical protein
MSEGRSLPLEGLPLVLSTLKQVPIGDQEESLLLAECLRLGDNERLTARLSRFSPENWNTIVSQAQRHGVMPLVAWRLKALEPGIRLPQELGRALQESLVMSAARNLRLFHELGILLQELKEAGLPVIALKGVHLASLIYPDIALRPMIDADLLLRKEHLPQADAIARSLGYSPYRRYHLAQEVRRHHHLPLYTKAGSLALELHWGLAPPTSSLKIDVEGLWSRAEAAQIAGAPLQVLSQEDLLLHLCLHLCRSQFFPGLRGLCDIAQVLSLDGKRPDWEQLEGRAEEWGVLQCVRLVLWLANELLEAPLPPGDDLAAQEASQAQLYALARRQVLELAWPPHPALNTIWQAKTLAEKTDTFLRYALLPPELIARKYALPGNSKKVYFYYLVNLKDLLVEASHRLRQTPHVK